MYTVSSNYINEKFNSKEDYLREEKKIDEEIKTIAGAIAERSKEKPIVLLSGPSGSGKTTTAHKIEEYLDANGHNTHVVSLDNYFKTISPEEAETIDFESPSRIDFEMLSDHIKKISECREVELPTFDFITRKSVLSGKKLKRKKGEIVIFEGIHALNPDAVSFDDDITSKLYVSVRTRVSCGNEVTHPKFIRLLRRMSRDAIYRGRDVYETAEYFKSVERGEELFVAPFKRFADFSIDTFVSYEPKIYKKMLLQRIKSAEKNGNAEVLKCLERFLENFSDGDETLVGKTSIIREFIGDF